MSTSYLPLNLAQNPIVVNVDAADPVLITARAGLRYYLELMVPDFYGANTFSQLVEFEQSEIPPEEVAGGVIYRGANFELQDQLDSLLFRNAPVFDQTGIRVCDGLVTPYYVHARITNNDDAVYEHNFPVEFAIKAGIAERDFSVFKSDFFTAYIGVSGKFLTWSEDGKRVQMNQPEFLYWLSNCSPLPSQLALRCEVIYASLNTDPEVFTVTTLSGVTAMTVYCLAVGPSALGLIEKALPVAGYKVWLEDQNGAMLSEVRTFRVDPEFRRNVRIVLFANSLGGFDTICFTGQGEESVKFTRSVSDRYPDYAFEPQYSEQIINGVTGERELAVNTGWLKPYGRTYLQELLLSKELYIVTDRAFLPLVPVTDSFRAAVDDEGPIGRELIFRYANPERNFSSLPKREFITVRPTAWRPKATACLLDNNGRRTGKKGVMLLEKYYLDDNTRVREAPIKPNVPGTEGYIAPDNSLDCQVTPFLSAGISRATTYDRSNCPNGQVGGPAMIVIAAGTYGSELSQADADAKAEADYKRQNTQAYTDINGTCVVAPEIYDWAVPAGKWHYRTGKPSKLDIVFRDTNNYPIWGNSYFLQNQGGANVYPFGSNDLDFPVGGSGHWDIRVYGNAGSSKRVRTYRNAVLVNTSDVTLNQDGYEQVSWLPGGFTFNSGDKLYIRVDDL
ncbi:DUF5977 domain-containing protein [Spirosoma endbachense]|uniref:DUF5977 domain-containing protein n=1 Tax=Spirosoma endbachense TaxID=2666025 RepID=A0A6P1VXL9_9BACT|nr:DUF5977 domain-containing protein [Spirosoma endbachense]QHV97941.1 hypothetical protein GJR95_24325 [Spirosoma endbachense]